MEFEIGDETLDFASLLDLFTSLESNFAESLLFPTISFFEGPCDWVIKPYNTSAISISSSSGFEDNDFDDDFGGLGLGPLGFIFFRTEALEEDGEIGAAGGVEVEAKLALTGEFEAWR